MSSVNSDAPSSRSFFPTGLDHSHKPSAEFQAKVAAGNFEPTSSQIVHVTEVKTIETVKEIPVVVDRPVVVEKRVEIPVNKPTTVTVTKTIPERVVYIDRANPDLQRQYTESVIEASNLRRENELLKSRLSAYPPTIREREETVTTTHNYHSSDNFRPSSSSSHFSSRFESNPNLGIDSSELRRLEQRLRALEEDNQRLRSEADDANQRRISSESKLHQAEADLELARMRTKAEVEKARKEAQGQEDQRTRTLIDRYESTKHELHTQLDQERSRKRAQTEETDRNEHQQTRQLEILQTKIIELERDLAKQKAKAEAEAEARGRLERELTDTNRSHVDQMGEMRRIVDQRTETSTQHIQLIEDENRKLKSEVQRLKSEAPNPIDRIREVDRITETYNTKVSEAVRNQSAAEQKARDLEQQLRAHESTVRQLKSRIEVLEGSQGPLELSSLLDERTRLITRHETLESRIRDLQNRLEAREAELERVTRRLEEAGGRLKRSDSEDTIEHRDLLGPDGKARNENEILMRNNTMILELQLQEAHNKLRLEKEKRRKTKGELLTVTMRLVSSLSVLERRMNAPDAPVPQSGH